MGPTSKYLQGGTSLLHNAAVTLPVPAGAAGDTLFRTPVFGANSPIDAEQVPVVLLGDLVFVPNGGLTSLTGPVHLWARTSTFGAVDQWGKVELIEAVAVDLAQGPVSYRLRLSPWWDRVAVAAPVWAPVVGQSVTVRFYTYMA